MSVFIVEVRTKPGDRDEFPPWRASVICHEPSAFRPEKSFALGYDHEDRLVEYVPASELARAMAVVSACVDALTVPGTNEVLPPLADKDWNERVEPLLTALTEGGFINRDGSRR